MGTLMPATPTQTLYVTVRRDELRQLKDERDQLRQRIETAVEELRTSRWDNARKAGYRFDEAKWMERDLRIESALKALKVKL